MSQGITADLFSDSDIFVEADATFTIDEDIVSFTNTSENATSFLWLFGDGQVSTEENPVHDYIDGDFTATLIADNGCDSDTIDLPITILTSIEDSEEIQGISVFPNPNDGRFNLIFDTETERQICIYSLEGNLLLERSGLFLNETFHLENIPEGVIMLSIQEGQNRVWKKLVVLKN